MQDLSYPQYRVLKKIYKGKIKSVAPLNDYHLEICAFLEEHNFIMSFSDLSCEAPIVKVTQLGEAALHEKKLQFIQLWVPIAISFVALIVSILALRRTI